MPRARQLEKAMSPEAAQLTHDQREGLSRIGAAACYRIALQTLINNVAADDFDVVQLPANMLAGFTLELPLKGYLLLHGWKSSAVRKLNHNITKLIDEARKLGLPDDQELDRLRDTLGARHADFTYRYINSGGELDFFDWPRVMEIIDRLFEAVGAAVSEAEAGLLPR